jgi:hypothetical protein
VAAISDSFFVRENVEQNVPIGINENMDEAIAAYARVRKTADLIVPLYDPANLERYGNGRVA